MNLNHSFKEKEFARLYDDIIQALGREKTDIDTIEFCIQKYGNPILEMGCGTGIKLIYFATKGYLISGIDFSQGMLDVLDEKIKKLGIGHQIKVIYDDIAYQTQVSFQDKFSVIFFSGSLFLYLDSDEKRISCLKNTKKLLRDDGVILLINSNLENTYNWKQLPITGKYDISDRFFYNQKGYYQRDFNIKLLGADHETMYSWYAYPIADDHMKELMKEAGLKSISIPNELPVRANTYTYLCKNH